MANLITQVRLQEMLTECHNNNDLRDNVEFHFNGSDYMDICDVIDDGYIERFDRYDSDLAEQFIRAYELAKMETE